MSYNGFDEEVNTNTKHINDNSIIFFLETDVIHTGVKMKLHFITNDDGAKFLPIKVAQQIPFSSGKLSEILNLFSLKPKSANVEIIEETIKMCEAKAINGEDKHCISSFEDLVDYVISKTGGHVKVCSMNIDEDVLMEFKVIRSQKISTGDDNLVCHKMSYPYAVFYCHILKKIDVYDVSLVGADRNKINAVAVCHKDTSSWNPRHLAFQVLKVKPGIVPICHFLNGVGVAWAPY